MLPEAPRAQIEEWLRALGCTPIETPDAQSTWHFDFEYPTGTGHHMAVGSPVQHPAATVIASAIQLTPQHLQNFSNLDDEEKERFLWSLRQKANCTEVDFQFFDVANRLDCPTKIQFGVARYADGLTMDSFAQTVGAVFKMELGTIWLVEEQLGGGEVGPDRRFDFKKLGL